MSQATLPGRYRNSNLFSGYYLDERVFGLDEWDCDEEAERAFEELQDLYAAERGALESYDEDPLRRHWIDEVLSILGYEPLSETPILDARGSIDRTLYDSGDDRRAGAVMKADNERAGIYGRSLSILEAKRWNADFTDRFGERRSYRDASHQIKYYLEHTPESVSWGILTNGKQWRLYGTKDYETETYYEVDLVDLLESNSVEVFKYFYVFFRPAAFRETGGTTFLDRVWSESETAAQELGEDLQDNVFTALRVLGEGFVETNGLDIDPTEEERLADLKEHSLVLLYRLMFVLYAESRGLIDPDDPHAATEYEENFGLDALRRAVIEEVGERADESDFEREFSSFSTRLWGQLENLFSLVDSGNDELGIPAYNGGLFDEDDHEFLAANEVSDRHLAEVIYRLSTTETEDGHVAAEYADLDTRHLGTIYEGLLEHEFAVAPEAQAAVAGDGGQVWKPADEVSVAEAVEVVEKGELYVVNDDGERKATGAYYTPDYVVTYIVEETVGPLLEEIEEEIELEPGTEEYVVAFWERVTDLKILDPAMGSGHFLTKATGYLADAVMERVRELESGSLFDEELVRRTVSRECIYGVDVNGMAVELAKLSMWLETLAADQPLAFLDHHLKSGNSLVGSDITDVLAEDDESGQLTLADFARTRRRALGKVMNRMNELLAIDNETLEEIHSMEDLYADIREDPLYEHLQAMATVHTAGAFGLDIPEDAIERMARAIEAEGEWAALVDTDWFRAARAMADEEGFFHWELEFPAVFFDGDGERLASAGFDAVVGNPPYVRSRNLPKSQKSYYKDVYHSGNGAFDIYILFIEKFGPVSRSSSFIVPNKWTTTNYGRNIRNLLLNEYSLSTVVDVSDLDVFPDADIYPVVITYGSAAHTDEIRLKAVDNPEAIHESTRVDVSHNFIEKLGDQVIPVNLDPEFEEVASTIVQQSAKLGDYVTMTECIHTGNVRDKLVVDDEIDSTCKKLIGGDNVNRYLIDWDEKYIRYDESLIDSDSDEYGDLREQALFETDEKLFIRDVSYRPVAVYDDKDFYALNTLYSVKQNRNSDLSLRYILGVFNSEFVNRFFRQIYGGTHVSGGYLRFKPMFSYNIPIPNPAELTHTLSHRLESMLGQPMSDAEQAIERLTVRIEQAAQTKADLNLDLLDYLGTYEDGPTLGELNYGPASGLHESMLTDTQADSEFETLRVTGAKTERDGDRLRVLAVPYVKPENPDEYETNARGYATLDPVPAMEFVGLSEAEAALVEAFVPHAVAEAGGFAGYRDNATATISPLDRLEDLTLPKLADVEGGVERYMDARERAAELDEKIERTDELIDEIVYELYGLTDDEIQIVEEAVGE